jgi:hypothetical protein
MIDDRAAPRGMHAARQRAMLCRKLAVCRRGSGGTHARPTIRRETCDDRLRGRDARPTAVPRARAAGTGSRPVAGAGSGRPDAAGGLMRVLLAAIVACIVLAIVVALVTTSDFGTAVAITLGGTAFVLVISAAFYAVGRSEDRERAREAEKR